MCLLANVSKKVSVRPLVAHLNEVSRIPAVERRGVYQYHLTTTSAQTKLWSEAGVVCAFCLSPTNL
jgi:hypothetical protein